MPTVNGAKLCRLGSMAGSDAQAEFGRPPIEHCPNGRAPEIVVFLRGGGSIAGRLFRLSAAWLNPAEGPVTVKLDGDVAVPRTFVAPGL